MPREVKTFTLTGGINFADEQFRLQPGELIGGQNVEIAVSGGYWKPVLQVEVAPDAEHRFEELQMALQNSGFDLKRKTR